MFCKHCSNELHGDNNYCPKCGKALSESLNVSTKDARQGNRTLRALGIISILFGPILAFILGYNEYQSVYRSARVWHANASWRGRPTAVVLAEEAVEAMLPILLLIVAAGVIFGIILLVSSRKDKLNISSTIKNSKKSIFLILSILAVLIFLFTACSSNPQADTTPPAEESEITYQPTLPNEDAEPSETTDTLPQAEDERLLGHWELIDVVDPRMTRDDIERELAEHNVRLTFLPFGAGIILEWAEGQAPSEILPTFSWRTENNRLFIIEEHSEAEVEYNISGDILTTSDENGVTLTFRSVD